jgi:DNA-binding response OmpR family regulator
MKIALADDEADLREYLAEYLEHYGFDVIQFEDGLDLDEYLGLSMGTPPQTMPDLLITDITMPGLTGLEVLKKLRVVYPTLPVLLIAAFATEEIHEEAKNLRTVILHKPFDPKKLLKVVREELKKAS